MKQQFILEKNKKINKIIKIFYLIFYLFFFIFFFFYYNINIYMKILFIYANIFLIFKEKD